MIVRVSGPHGSGKYNVVKSGLEATGLSHFTLVCSLADPLMDLQPALDRKEDIIILTDLETTRPDFRQEIMEAVKKRDDRIFWIVG